MAVIIAFSRILLIAGLAALATAASGATWQPSQPVRRTPCPVQGGTVDLLARLVAPHLQQAFEHPVIVEPRPGAGGDLGTDLVAKAAPDGTTILVAFTAPITVNATLMGNLRYDPLKDLLPITLAVSTPQFLTINPAVPARSVSEFVAYATAHPGQLNYASVSIGSASHLTMEMLKATAGIDMLHVPYKGAVSGGQPSFWPIACKRLCWCPATSCPICPRASCACWRRRDAGVFQERPKYRLRTEFGYPDFEAIAWIGFMAPGGTPQPIIDRYHEEIVKTLALPEVRQRLTSIYFDVVASMLEQFRDYIRWETPRWAKVIHDTGVKPD